MSERHREALAHLLFGVTGVGGFVLFTGNIGTGKTTVCRCFLEQVPAGCNVAIVFNPKLSVLELLQTICEEFDVAVDAKSGSSLKTYVSALNTFLLQSHAAGQNNVLIIDEAQNLLPEVLEQLRLLTNLETHERKLLQIVLIGQPELRTMLERPELEQLAQRVIARYHLEALNEAETRLYIQHRLTVAGHNGPLPFDSRALHRIHKLTGGVPRRINLLCGRILLGAWAKEKQRVDRRMVDQSANEVFGGEHARRSYAAPLLGVFGVLCLAGALFLQMGVRPGAASAVAAVRPSAAVSAPVLPASVPAPAASVASASASAAVLASEPASAPAPAPARTTASAPASSSAPASAPVAATAPAVAASVPAQVLPIEDLQALLPLATQDVASAWRALGTLWQFNASQGDPCQAAASAQLQCYRTSDLTVPSLRQLDRPGILGLQKGNDAPVYVVLTGLSDRTATLRLGGQLHRVTLVALARFWRGDYGTYWKPPVGYRGDMRDSEASTVYGQLSQQLAQLEGRPAGRTAPVAARPLDAALAARVKAFQRGQGIKSNGHPGPMTFMQIEQALGLSGPSLQAGPP